MMARASNAPDEPTVGVPAADEAIPDGLIRPINRTPTIDLSRPEDCPDLPDGEWSKQHLLQFLARQPRDVVFIPKEPWEPKGEETYQYVGFQGHGFRIRKGRTESVPIQIAAIIEQSQEEFPTTQSQANRRALTNILDMAPEPGSLGVPGVQTFLQR